ncbi:hypothetical protein ACHQM5_005020 [Ranunculus cassubicifolius]
MWLVSRDRMLTQCNLKRRGTEMASRCVFCCREEEDGSHLFVLCPFIRELCDYFYGVMACQDLNDLKVEQRLQREGSDLLSQAGKWYWQVIHHAIMWNWWLERNKRMFDDEKLELWQVTNIVKETLWQWGLNCLETRGVTKENLIFNFARVVREM